MSKLQQTINAFRNEIGADFIATDIVGTDGISIAGTTSDPTLDTTPASARYAMVMKLSSKVSEKLGMGKVEDNLVTTNTNFIISRFLGDSSYFWAVAVTKEATLGTVRMLMNEYAEELWDAIPR